MRVLVVQNYDGTGLGLLEPALAEAGAEVDLVRAHQGMELPRGADAHDALIVLGGGQNALDDADWPHLPPLVALMRDFVEADRAVLGICLGSQLLARACGAENLIGQASEFAWRDVSLTEAGKADPVLGGLPETFPIFHWHDDTFALPAGAVRLATNLVTPNQAFRTGRAAYGIQFHFEADRALVRRWNVDFADYIAQTRPDWPARHEAEAALHGPEADRAGMQIARAWVALI